MNHVNRTLAGLVLAAMVFVLVLGGVLAQAAPAQAANASFKPAISLGALSHREELRATVNAKTKLTHLELRVDTKKVQPWVKAHAGWKYSVRYPLNKLAVGMHTARLKVWNQKNFTTERQWEFQKLAQLGLTASRSSVQPGEKVILTGQGFTPGTAVTVGMGSQNTGVGGNYGSAVAGSDGAFSVEVTLDRFPDGSPLHAGTITLLAHNSDGSEKASAQLQVQANPELTASKSTLRVGEVVTLSGEGFTPGKTVTIHLAGVNMGHGDQYGSVVANADGRFSYQLTLARYPDGTPLPPGGITLMASTADGERAMVGLQLVATPSISLNKTSIQAGEQVAVTGQGFTPGASITISMGPVNGGAGGDYGSTRADTNGRFSLAVTLARYPDGSPLRPGAIVLVAHTPSFDQQASAQLQIAPVVDRAPSAASDLRITSLTKGSTSAEPAVVALQWRDNSVSETGFRIQATFTRMNGGTDTQVWRVAANSTTTQVSFAAGGINPVSKACFTVTAFNSQGDSSPSNQVCAVL